MYSVLMVLLVIVGCNLQNVDQEEIDIVPGVMRNNEFTLGSDSIDWEFSSDTFNGFSREAGVPVLPEGRSIDVTMRNAMRDGETINMFQHKLKVVLKQGDRTVLHYNEIGGDTQSGEQISGDTLFTIDSLTVEDEGSALKTYTIAPKSAICSGYYTYGYDSRFLIKVEGEFVVNGGPGGYAPRFYAEGNNYCDSVENDSVAYVDVLLVSGSSESTYELYNDTSYPYWEVVKVRGVNVDIALTSFDSTIIISGLSFLQQYADKEASNMDQQMRGLLLDTALLISPVELFSDSIIIDGNERKGDIVKYFVMNDFTRVYTNNSTVASMDHLIIDGIGQQFLVRDKYGAGYAVVVQSVDRTVPGKEEVVMRVYK
ncbi:MAG: hypothetical protein OCD01_10660 [Fibrobacterales bacterium]